MIILSQCPRCKNLMGGKGSGMFCRAFPKGIPDELILNKHDHKKPYPGDQGYRFEPIDDYPAQAGHEKS